MKNIILGLAISTISVSTIAADNITGTVLLSGIKHQVIVETNINTGKIVAIDQDEYRIDRINATNIAASRTSSPEESVEVLHGDVMEDLLKMSKSKITEYFGLQNKNEINCNQKSKAFLVRSNKNSILGNCVN